MNLIHLFNLLLVGAIWGSSFLFQRLIVRELDSYWMAILRLLGCGLFLSVYALFKKEKTKIYQKKAIFPLMGLGLLNTLIPMTFFAVASKTTPSSMLSVINAMVPIFAAFFAWSFAKEKLTHQQTFGLALGFTGVVILTLKDGFDLQKILGKSELGFGPMFGVAATFCYGLSNLWIKKLSKSFTPFEITQGTTLFSGIIGLTLACLIHPYSGRTLSTETVLYLCALSLVCTAIAYLLFYKLAANIGAYKASTVTFIIPVFGSVLGIKILNESYTAQMSAGAFLILCGTALVIYRK